MYLFISGTWQLLGLNSAHPVVNDLIPSALLFDPGSLILEPEATYGRPSPEAVEVTSRSLDVTQAAGFFVIIEAEFSAKAGYDRRRPDLESVLVEVLEVRHIPDGDFAQASGLIKEKAFKDVSTRDVLQVAEPVVRLFKGGKISLFRLPDDRPRLAVVTDFQKLALVPVLFDVKHFSLLQLVEEHRHQVFAVDAKSLPDAHHHFAAGSVAVRREGILPRHLADQVVAEVRSLLARHREGISHDGVRHDGNHLNQKECMRSF